MGKIFPWILLSVIVNLNLTRIIQMMLMEEPAEKNCLSEAYILPFISNICQRVHEVKKKNRKIELKVKYTTDVSLFFKCFFFPYFTVPYVCCSFDC